jgi:hypothetical protein
MLTIYFILFIGYAPVVGVQCAMMLQPMLVKNCIKWNCLFLDCVVLRKLQPLCC